MQDINNAVMDFFFQFGVYPRRVVVRKESKLAKQKLNKYPKKMKLVFAEDIEMDMRINTKEIGLR